ncbi:tRNA threonylcarbamoyl adenosine modification protein YeaZ [Bradyrhizobium elkanii]
MMILAIDTALDACSAAVLDTTSGNTIAIESQAMQRGHAEALMPLIARVMKESGIGFAGLDRIAVTTGPGSFTGLRVGLSAARGLALAAEKPVVGLSTLAAYAAPVVAENGASAILSAIDARHDHVYFQLVGGDGSPIIKPKAAPIAEALEASQTRRAASGRQRRQCPRRALARRRSTAGQGRPAARARYYLGRLDRRGRGS